MGSFDRAIVISLMDLSINEHVKECLALGASELHFT